MGNQGVMVACSDFSHRLYITVVSEWGVKGGGVGGFKGSDNIARKRSQTNGFGSCFGSRATLIVLSCVESN